MRLKTRLFLSALVLTPEEYQYNLTFGEKERLTKENFKQFKSKSDFFNITFKSQKDDNDYIEVSERLVENCVKLSIIELRTFVYLLLIVGDKLYNDTPISYAKIAEDINRFIEKYGYREYLGLEKEHIKNAVDNLYKKGFLEKKYQKYAGKYYVISAFYYGWGVTKEECEDYLAEINKDCFYEKDLIRELHPYDKIDLIIRKEEIYKENCFLFFNKLRGKDEK